MSVRRGRTARPPRRSGHGPGHPGRARRPSAVAGDGDAGGGVARQDPGVAQPRLCAVLTGAFPGCECIEWGQGAYGGSSCGFAIRALGVAGAGADGGGRGELFTALEGHHVEMRSVCSETRGGCGGHGAHRGRRVRGARSGVGVAGRAVGGRPRKRAARQHSGPGPGGSGRRRPVRGRPPLSGTVDGRIRPIRSPRLHRAEAGGRQLSGRLHGPQHGVDSRQQGPRDRCRRRRPAGGGGGRQPRTSPGAWSGSATMRRPSTTAADAGYARMLGGPCWTPCPDSPAPGVCAVETVQTSGLVGRQAEPQETIAGQSFPIQK